MILAVSAKMFPSTTLTQGIKACSRKKQKRTKTIWLYINLDCLFLIYGPFDRQETWEKIYLENIRRVATVRYRGVGIAETTKEVDFIIGAVIAICVEANAPVPAIFRRRRLSIVAFFHEIMYHFCQANRARFELRFSSIFVKQLLRWWFDSNSDWLLRRRNPKLPVKKLP